MSAYRREEPGPIQVMIPVRWPIRNQILVPFVIIQLISLLILTVTSAVLAVRQAEENLNQRLNNVVTSLQEATFPMTPDVLERLRSLSGAHFVVWDMGKQITQTTLQTGQTDLSSLPQLSKQREDDSTNIVNQQTVLVIGGERYFSERVRWKRGFGIDAVLVLYPEQYWQSARRQALVPSLVTGSIVLVLIIAASYWISNRIGNRIHRLKNQVSRIAQGEFEPVETAQLSDELKDLSEDINQMSTALKESLQNIRDTERAELITQLTGGLAHHLRNSLTGARMAVQLHQSRCQSRPEEESLARALHQLSLTEEQIKGLLRLTRGENRTSFPAGITDVLEGTIRLIEPIVKHKKIEFDYEGVETKARVADGDGVRAALLNLLMNAIEAAGPQGVVGLKSFYSQENQLVIEVSDNGPGVSPEIEREIFKPFFSTKQEGIGLGLALAEQAARDCDGSLSLDRHEDRTCFRLTLSIHQPEHVVVGN
ncbi:sensor histidine kinase [Polystyrenella longa]|uniref:sensor histidine kinase n=1 Tax=Polystyrenella longa TaxID=2528007 RepID=UPI00119D6CC9|nr:HAMP domain-containing sensor histidine kinase [Polystyrenella longa]